MGSLNEILRSGVSALAINVQAVVHVENLNSSNVEVSIIGFNKSNGVSQKYKVLFNLSSYTTVVPATSWDMGNVSKVVVFVDSSNAVNESDERNNIVENLFRSRVRVFLDVDTGYSGVDNVIRGFVGNYGELVSISDYGSQGGILSKCAVSG